MERSGKKNNYPRFQDDRNSQFIAVTLRVCSRVGKKSNSLELVLKIQVKISPVLIANQWLRQVT